MLWAEGRPLEDYLSQVVFRDMEILTIAPAPEQAEEYARYLETFMRALPVEAAAAEVF